MENKKLLSARLDPQTLEKIEAFTKRHYYWKRNTVINNVLGAVFDCFEDSDIYDMVRYVRHYHRESSGSFSLEKDSSN